MLLLVIVLTLVLLAIASSVHSVASASGPTPVDARVQWRERFRSMLPKAESDHTARTRGEGEGDQIDDSGAGTAGRHAPPDTFPPRAEGEWIARTIPARRSHQILFDAARNRVLIIGGEHNGAIWNDIWAINLDAPIRAERVIGSGPRFGPGIAAVIDPQSDRLWVHGGRREGEGHPGPRSVFDEGGPFSTSIATTERWTRLDNPYLLNGVRRPSARHGHAAVVDEARRRIVLLGGRSYDEIYGWIDASYPKRDVWAWSLDSLQGWDSLAVSGRAPVETVGEGAAYDRVLDAVWYVARGGVWKLDLESSHWDSIAASGASDDADASIAFDPVGRKLYRYAPSFGLQVLNVDTPAAWSAVPGGSETRAASGPMAWDSRARRLLRFSGVRAHFPGRIPVEGPALWGFSVDQPDHGWQVIYDGRIPQLVIATGVYDARRDRILAIDRSNPQTGLYELRGGQSQWSNLHVDPVPPEFRGTFVSMVLDEAGDRLVLDAIAMSATSSIDVNTYFYDLRAPGGWQLVSSNAWDLPPDLVWDAARQRVIRFGWSQGSSGWQSRVQALEGTPGAERWRSIPVAGSSQPGARVVPLVASDERGRVFVIGGTLPLDQDIQNLWILEVSDSARWTKQRHEAYFDPNSQDWPAMAWDPERELLMIHGLYDECCGWRSDGIGMSDRGAVDSFAFPHSAEWFVPPRWGAGFVYDSAHDAFLVFAGTTTLRNDGPSDPLSDAFVLALARPSRTIRVDARPSAGNDRVRPGTHQTLQVAALSDAGFDARTLDLATVRAAGVPVRRDGGGRPMFTVRDVDGDGREDIVVAFDAHDLPITETNVLVKLWGRTFDERRVEGLATVAVNSPRGVEHANSSGSSTTGPMFSVRTDGPAVSLRFACTVAGLPGARIEAFDIAGRRVASGKVPSHGGVSVVDLVPEAPLARGIYVVRLTGPATLSRKVVALP